MSLNSNPTPSTQKPPAPPSPALAAANSVQIIQVAQVAEVASIIAESQQRFERMMDHSDQSLTRTLERCEQMITKTADLAERIASRECAEDDPKRGFPHAGEFFLAVRKTGNDISNPTDARLKRLAAAPSTFGNEASGADGGFLVPPEFATSVATLALMEDSLLPFCDVVPIESNSMVFPQSEVTPWGSTATRAYWQGSGTAGTQTKPVARADTLRCNKLLALVPITTELSDDAIALGAFLTTEIGNSIRWKANESLLFGDDDAKPLGVFTSGAQITIAKESGQATQTVLANNITKMAARLPPGSFSRAIWLFNGDTLPGFFGISTISTIYWPGGRDLVPSGITAVFGQVLGRPALISAHAKAFSSQGDILLVDMSYVRAIQRAPGIQIASSMHIYFDADALAFRATFRLDAQPKLTTPVNPSNGSTTLSPFLQLGAR